MLYKRPTFLPILISLLSTCLTTVAQPYSVWKTSLSFTDVSRSNRVIDCDIYYPAIKSGTNVAIAGSKEILFPLISFGHGFVMTVDAYSNIWNMLVPEGYIVILPKTEGSFSPSHANFGKDLSFVLEAFRVESAKSNSIFFQRVAGTSAVMGHSMGGGAAHLAAANNSNITTIITLAAAETNPSAIQAAKSTSQPALVIAGGNDCITPPQNHQIPIYNALISSCKTYLSLNGASHCQMAESNFNCSFGEGTCNPKPAITKNEQHALLKKYILPWLNSQLKNDCAASQLFNNQINNDLKITIQNKCDFCIVSDMPSNLTLEKTGKVFPNPFNQQLTLSSQLCSESDFTCVLQSMDGRNVLSKTFSQNYFSNHPIQLNTADITPGLYILKIMGRHKSETYLLMK